jgi:glycerol kinase
MGAAALAGLGVGFWTSPKDLVQARQLDRCFQPKMGVAERDALYRGWRAAVARVRSAP